MMLENGDSCSEVAGEQETRGERKQRREGCRRQDAGARGLG